MKSSFLTLVWACHLLVYPLAGAAAGDALVLSVDPAAGSEALHFGTLQEAADEALKLAAAGQPVRIEVAAGVYREAVTLKGESGEDYAPISILGRGEVELTGTELLKGWEIGRSGFFEIEWPHDYAPLLFVQGVRVIYRQDKTQPEVGECVLVDKGRTLRMLPPRNAVVAEGNVEVARREKGLEVSGLPGITLSNLHLGKTRGAERAALRIMQTGVVRLEAVTAEYSPVGIWVTHARQLLLEGCTASRNLIAGARLYWCQDVSLLGGEFSLNGVFSQQGDSYGLGLRKVSTVVVRRSQCADNAVGMLLSYVGTSAEIDGLHCFANRKDGLEAVAVTGLQLTAAILANNGASALLLRGSRGLVRNSILYGAETSAPLLLCQSFNQVEFRDNIIASGRADVVLAASGATEVLGWSQNLYYSKHTKPFSWEGQSLDFSGWREKTGDRENYFADPLFVDPGQYEFALRNASPWFNKGNWQEGE